MDYVIAAYVATIVLIGGYALSVFLRRRAVQREMAAWQVGEGESRERDGAPMSEIDQAPAPDSSPAETQ